MHWLVGGELPDWIRICRYITRRRSCSSFLLLLCLLLISGPVAWPLPVPWPRIWPFVCISPIPVNVKSISNQSLRNVQPTTFQPQDDLTKLIYKKPFHIPSIYLTFQHIIRGPFNVIKMLLLFTKSTSMIFSFILFVSINFSIWISQY